MTSSCSSTIKRTSQGLLFKNGYFFSAFILCFPLSLAATITVINNPIRKALGDDVTLEISIDESVLVCTWHRGIIDLNNFILRVSNGVQGEGSQYTRRESFVLPSHSLRIMNATLADSGTYWVRIVFTSGNEVQSNLTLTLLERISRVEVNISKNNVVEYKESVVLSCRFTGTQDTVQWIKDSQALEIKPGIELSNNNLSLHIRNASREHIGNYSCNASNAISYSISNSQHLNVYYSRLENGNLSAGAIAGISIGVVVCLALILTVGAVLLKKLRMPDENRSNGIGARTYENANVSNGLPIYENRLSDVHYQGKTGRTVESETSVYTDLQFKSDSTYSELERSKNKA